MTARNPLAPAAFPLPAIPYASYHRAGIRVGSVLSVDGTTASAFLPDGRILTVRAGESAEAYFVLAAAVYRETLVGPICRDQ
jgi:hypothetical protein